jgi:AraC family transcriptional regulator
MNVASDAREVRRMKASESRKLYEERVGRVVDHVFDHLDEELDLNRLADVACLSPYHWHRVYQAMRGETIAATVKRLRLDRAATLLVQTSLPVEEVARRSGYGNLQSFTRIFADVYGMPPATYRREGSHRRFNAAHAAHSHDAYDVRIETLPPLSAVTALHVGPYMEINRAFDRLFGWLAARDLVQPGTRMFAIFYGDVDLVPEAELRSRACAVIGAPTTIDPPFELVTIPGGDCAVLRHKGPYADMKAAYQWFYGTWLPSSGREPADSPGLEEYLNHPRDTAPTDLLADMFLPLKP